MILKLNVDSHIVLCPLRNPIDARTPSPMVPALHEPPDWCEAIGHLNAWHSAGDQSYQLEPLRTLNSPSMLNASSL